MKTIGLIGGTTWLSTIAYYRTLNQLVNARLGGVHFARIVLYSVNFHELMELRPDLDRMYQYVSSLAAKLKTAGADCLMLGANTLHMFASRLEEDHGLPVIHIARATAAAIREKGLDRVGLLGTKLTMEMDFYKDILAGQGIAVITPGEEEREYIDRTIYNDFLHDVFTPETRDTYLEIIGNLEKRGAKGIILGCTEIPLLLQQEHCRLPLFDTTQIHAAAAVEFALS